MNKVDLFKIGFCEKAAELGYLPEELLQIAGYVEKEAQVGRTVGALSWFPLVGKTISQSAAFALLASLGVGAGVGGLGAYAQHKLAPPTGKSQRGRLSLAEEEVRRQLINKYLTASEHAQAVSTSSSLRSKPKEVTPSEPVFSI